jgi:hypothetical protein
VSAGKRWHSGWRWIVVLTGVAALCSLPALAAALPTSVPARTPRQLESQILGSQKLSFSGYAESDATFGLPSLPDFSTVTPLLDGVTRMRVWQAAEDRWRVDTLSDAGENDTYQAGDNTFTWDSGEQLLTGVHGSESIRLPRAADLEPAALAVRMINEAGPGAKLGALPPRRVAGQSAAGLTIRPASPQSTIAQADIWASPATGLPLLVELFGRGSAQPALQTQFLQVGLWTPASGVLTPRLGPGAGSTTATPNDFAGVLGNLGDVALPGRLAGFARQRSPVKQVGVYGTGLSAFAVITVRHGGELVFGARRAGATPLTLSGNFGAAASAPLVNLVLVHSHALHATYVLIGLVSRTTLEQAAAVLAARPDQGT